jgi:hypothetical protein
MHRSKLITLLAGIAALHLAGCATSDRWAVSGADKANAVVRVSYEYPEFQEPELSDAQAEKLALNRCNGWGYDAAQPIAGQIRQCSNMADGNCDMWKVTREFQCTKDTQGLAGLAATPRQWAPRAGR